jgi:signal transduction histidine kinase
VKLLTKTNRYYFLLSLVLFGYLIQKTRQTHLPPSSPFDELMSVSTHPRPLGFSDTLILDAIEQELVPFRVLTFQVRIADRPQWITLRKSLLETKDILQVLFGTMATVLALLLLGVVVLNRWLSRWLWRPFQQTLAALRGYTLQRQPALALPATDIDEFAELNQALAQMSARLETDYRVLKEFTENAAHETQTPLSIMQAKLEQLMQLPALADGDAAPLLSDLYGATLRLSRLHHGLTLLSKIENRQFASATAVQLDKLITDKTALLHDFIDAKQLQLQLQLWARPTLQLNPALADSLVGNLLQNAVKHNYPGGTLTVTLTLRALEVVNTGPPLPPGSPEQFFGRFRKLHATSDSPGLGLSIVEQICQFYGYTLHYEVGGTPPLHTLRVVF